MDNQERESMSSPPMVRRLFTTTIPAAIKAANGPISADNDVFQSTNRSHSRSSGGSPKTAHSPSRPAQAGEAGSSKRGLGRSLGKKKRVCDDQNAFDFDVLILFRFEPKIPLSEYVYIISLHYYRR